MFKTLRASLAPRVYQRLTHTVTPEHHFFADRIEPSDVQQAMREGVAPQRMRLMLNFRNWVVPVDCNGQLVPINDALRGNGRSLMLFSEGNAFDAWNLWMTMRGKADPNNEAFQLPEGMASSSMSGLELVRAMVHAEADQNCNAILVDLERWIAKAAFRSAFAWHNNLLVEAALTSLSMGAQPHIMPATGQYLTLNLVTEDKLLVVYTDAPSLIEYQEEIARAEGGTRLPLYSLTGKGLIDQVAQEGLDGVLFNPGTPIELMMDRDLLKGIPGHADESVDDSLNTAGG